MSDFDKLGSESLNNGARYKNWTESLLGILESIGSVFVYFVDQYSNCKKVIGKSEKLLTQAKKELNLPCSLYEKQPCSDYIDKMKILIFEQQNLWELEKFKLKGLNTKLTDE